ncbi:hypothetical protein Dimus_007453 [Dionaea muscipula]
MAPDLFNRVRDPVTLFLDNIPDSFTARGLYMLAKQIRKGSDVFIPGRRRLFTRSGFGFATANKNRGDAVSSSGEAGSPTRERGGEQGEAARRNPDRRRENALALLLNNWHTGERRGHPIFRGGVYAYTTTAFSTHGLWRKVATSHKQYPGIRWRRYHGFGGSGHWSNGCGPGVLRDAWIKCLGLPHQLRNIGNPARIGEIWGEVGRGDHVLDMMALAFGWFKIGTDALQPIAEEVSLVNNGVLYRIHVHEESVFTPEQWLRRSDYEATSAARLVLSKRRWRWSEDCRPGGHTFRESWLSKGFGGAGIYGCYGTPLAAGRISRKGDAWWHSICWFDGQDQRFNFPTLGGSIVPFVPSTNSGPTTGLFGGGLGPDFRPDPFD